MPQTLAETLQAVLPHLSGALADPELDDTNIGKAARMKRVFLDDGLNLLPARTDRQNDPTVPRNLSTRGDEMP